jgi:hypothetical protein
MTPKTLLCAALVLHAAAALAQPNDTPGAIAETRLYNCRDCAMVESVLEQARRHGRTVWVTTVKMRDGRLRTYVHDERPAWGAGSVVHVRGRWLSPA